MDRLFPEMETETEIGEGSVRDAPSEFEGKVEAGGEVDEIDKFCSGAGGSPNVVLSM